MAANVLPSPAGDTLFELGVLGGELLDELAADHLVEVPSLSVRLTLDAVAAADP